MKKIITIIIALTFTFLASSCVTTMYGELASEEQREAEFIYEFPSLTEEEVFLSAETWFVEMFTSSESVIELRNRESGRIAGKYTFSYLEMPYYYIVKTTVIVDVRDNRARIIMINPLYDTTGDFLGTSYGLPNYKPLVSQVGIDRAQEEWAQLAESFQIYIESPSAGNF